MNKVFIILSSVFLLLGSVSQPLCAQEPIGKSLHLTLRESVLLSLRMNPTIESAQLQRVIDKFSVALAYNQFEFQYSLNGTGNATQSVSGGPPINLTRSFNMIPGISKLTTYGTQYTLLMNNPVNFSSGTGSNYLYNPSLNLTVSHPIIQGSGEMVVTAALDQALITNEQAKLNLKNTLITQVTLIIQDYLAVVSAENNLIIDKNALVAAEKTVKQNKVLIKIGFMAPSENVQAMTAVATQKLQIAQDTNTLVLAKLTLLKDIGLPSTTQVTIDKNIQTNNIKYPKGEEAKRILFANNISYLQALLSIQSSKLALILAEDQQRWVLNMTGNIVQGAGSGIGPNGGLPSIFNGLNNSRSLGLQLTVPIDNLALQQTLVNAKISYSQLKLNTQQLKLTLEVALIGYLENLEILYQQIELAKESEALAKQSYLDSAKKASFGQASMFEVTTLQNSYVSSQLQTVSSEINYLLNVANYQQNLGISLDVWDIKIKY